MTHEADLDETMIVIECRCPHEHPWLRDAVIRTARRDTKPRLPAGWHLWGWAMLGPGPRYRARRYWFTKDTDAGTYGSTDWPYGAVSPHDIWPGRASRMLGDPRASR